MGPSDTFARQQARTLRFTLGTPRSFTVSPAGERVVFVRSGSGTDRVNRLWVLDVDDVAHCTERVVADPAELLGGAEEELSPEEQARRQRSREAAGGIVGYATDERVETAAFALSGRLFSVNLSTAAAVEVAVPTPAVDPRPSPDGRHIAYVHAGALRVVTADGKGDRPLAVPEHDEATWGLAEFIAAEEMDRTRGFWWSPDSHRLLAAHVDNSPVQRWWIADPSRPDESPTPVRYPAAGTANADVSLAVLDLDGTRTEVEWDREAYPYLATVHWSDGGPPIIHAQARSQRRQVILEVDPSTGRTRQVHAEEDPAWLELFPGVPAWTPAGRLVHVADHDGARVLTLDGRSLTGPWLHVRAVVDVAEDSVLVTASAGEGSEDAHAEIGQVHVYRVSEDSVERVSDRAGLHTAARSGPTTVLSSSSLDRSGAVVRVLRAGRLVTEIASYAQRPGVTARPVLTHAGDRRIPCAVLLPAWHGAGDAPLPVLMDPYGGPHGQRVVAAHNAYLTSQWFADQGFAVVVADGRGTPGRSPAWEKAVHHNLAGAVLDDQVEALHALAEQHPMDLQRVAVRGWSFGGYLAALAVLRRPDVFHAAIAGAPVADQRLYDTHYKERYLGHPAEQPDVYAANSLVTDDGLSQAADTARPLMIIHGLADDNVHVAHSLRLSTALLAAGRPHEVLPLSGVTHMPSQEHVAENLLLLQVDFLKRALRLGS